MDFISNETFLDQPKKIQQIFIDWWKPEIGDLFTWKFSEKEKDGLLNVQCCNSSLEIKITTENKGLKIGDRIPLLTEGQLRQFIEDKANCTIDISTKKREINCKYEYKVTLWGRREYESYTIEGDSFLDAYWEVAIDIIKELESEE